MCIAVRRQAEPVGPEVLGRRLGNQRRHSPPPMPTRQSHTVRIPHYCVKKRNFKARKRAFVWC
jgi:hypothetical protein